VAEVAAAAVVAGGREEQAVKRRKREREKGKKISLKVNRARHRPFQRAPIARRAAGSFTF
jgi:hypothetical protein